jgi:hypothetical protein
MATEKFRRGIMEALACAGNGIQTPLDERKGGGL